MWVTEHSIETTAGPEAIWRHWSDVDRWPEWNGDIERIDLDGPFAVGSRITMTPIGAEPVELRIAEAVEPEVFVDEADLGEIVVRTIHRVQRLDEGRARVTYRMEITGQPQIPSGLRSALRSAATSLKCWPRWLREPNREPVEPRGGFFSGTMSYLRGRRARPRQLPVSVASS
jgi:Polyketide cyclase / dehydrase and lipid transport